jgi:hypothetical protein
MGNGYKRGSWQNTKKGNTFERGEDHLDVAAEALAELAAGLEARQFHQEQREFPAARL